MIPKILLSFDIEEFDMPLEYGFEISPKKQFEIGKNGLDALMPILENSQIQTTLFTTANFANQYPAEIIALSKQHEIASHTYFHSKFETTDLLTSRLKLEEIIKKPVTGLRMPRMKQVPIQDIINAGYQYDASIHPTWLPGRYNNLGLPRTIFKQEGLARIPASVTPNFRIPLFWLSFKNFPYSIYRTLAMQTLKRDGYISLYFHPWEFVNIDCFELPNYTKKGCNGALLAQLSLLIKDLQNQGQFITMQQFQHTYLLD